MNLLKKFASGVLIREYVNTELSTHIFFITYINKCKPNNYLIFIKLFKIFYNGGHFYKFMPNLLAIKNSNFNKNAYK